MIERQVEHLVRLVDDLLDVSRITRGKVELKRELVELAEVVANARRDGEPAARAAQPHADRRRAARRAAWSTAIRCGWRRSLANLLTNAAKLHAARRPHPAVGATRRRPRSCSSVERQRRRHRARHAAAHLRAVRAGAAQPRSRRGRARPRPDARQAAWSSCTAARSARSARGSGKGSDVHVRLPAPSAAVVAGKRRAAAQAPAAAGRARQARAGRRRQRRRRRDAGRVAGGERSRSRCWRTTARGAQVDRRVSPGRRRRSTSACR